MRRLAAARMKGDRATLRIEEQSGDVLLATLDRPEVANSRIGASSSRAPATRPFAPAPI